MFPLAPLSPSLFFPCTEFDVHWVEYVFCLLPLSCNLCWNPAFSFHRKPCITGVTLIALTFSSLVPNILPRVGLMFAFLPERCRPPVSFLSTCKFRSQGRADLSPERSISSSSVCCSTLRLFPHSIPGAHSYRPVSFSNWRPALNSRPRNTPFSFWIHSAPRLTMKVFS